MLHRSEGSRTMSPESLWIKLPEIIGIPSQLPHSRAATPRFFIVSRAHHQARSGFCDKDGYKMNEISGYTQVSRAL